MKYIKKYEYKVELEPSYFAGTHPWNSVLRKTEAEIIASNIMKILKRTGDKWRKLDWEEYKKERLKDGNFSEKSSYLFSERYFFDQVIDYCTSSDNARKFSPYWKNIIEKDAEKYNL